MGVSVTTLIKRILPYGLAGFVLLLPWQVRYIFSEDNNPFATISFYGFDLVLLLIVGLWVWYWYHVKKPINWEWVALGLVCILVVLLSGYWATNRDLAFTAYLHFAFGIALIGISATVSLRLRLVSYCLMLNGLVQTMFAWIQSTLQQVSGHSWLGMATQLPETSGTAVIITSLGRWLRAYGTLPHPNVTGGLMVLALLATAICWSTMTKAWERRILLIITIILSSGLLLTFSRSALLVWVGFVLVGCWLWRSQRAIFLTSLLTLIILAIPFYPLWSARLDTKIYLEQYSLTERSTQFQEALSLWKRYWPMGVGIGQYTVHLGEAIHPQPVHLVPLLVAIEIGIVGTLLWYGVVIKALWQTKWHNSASRSTALWLIAILALGLFDHYFWTLPSFFYMWCLLLGLHLQLSKTPQKALLDSQNEVR